MSVPAVRRLAIVEVSRHRPDRSEYHAYVQILNGRMQAEANARGWLATRYAAQDLGTEALLAATEGADAIVIVGGEDISPALYGAGTGYPDEGAHAYVGDLAQIALVRRTLERRVPLLGVCRGVQILNVALGGTLVQDLGADTIHKNVGAPVHELMHAHEIEVVAGSGLAAVFGAGSLVVQSAHHQSVGVVAPGLVVTARAADGVVETLEHESAPVLALQWHPEDPGAPAEQLPLVLDALAEAARSGSFARSLVAA
ncbi:gamma-glutamyl-gamma-aminobutyrate hydrolase family protein [Microbacteriaceae bacterium VKM Ac-2854]|nr:gamma-glutamyl-gamma-aminobutyrate hydrolase family protein [Microbacteriaceae bacterium VKM Ac-2854]